MPSGPKKRRASRRKQAETKLIPSTTTNEVCNYDAVDKLLCKKVKELVLDVVSSTESSTKNKFDINDVQVSQKQVEECVFSSNTLKDNSETMELFCGKDGYKLKENEIPDFSQGAENDLVPMTKAAGCELEGVIEEMFYGKDENMQKENEVADIFEDAYHEIVVPMTNAVGYDVEAKIEEMVYAKEIEGGDKVAPNVYFLKLLDIVEQIEHKVQEAKALVMMQKELMPTAFFTI